MSHQPIKTYISSKIIYFKHSNYELWAHLSEIQLILQCKWYFSDGTIKVFIKSVTNSDNSSNSIQPTQTYKALIESKEIMIEHIKNNVILQIKTRKIQGSNSQILIKLQQMKGLSLIDNWCIINILNEKIQNLNNQLERQKIIYNMIQNQKILEIQPILHQNQLYRFQAQFDNQVREIKTELIVKLSSLDSKIRDKVYKSAIKQVEWETSQYKQRFNNLQTLFQHLRNPNNYEVSTKKGLIKIKNQPDLTLDLTNLNLKRLHTDRSHKSSKTLTNLKQIKSLLRKKTQDNLDFDDKNLELSKQLDDISRKIQIKMMNKLKASEKQLLTRQKQHQNKYEDKLADIQRELLKYLKLKVKQEMQKVKKQLNISLIELNKSEISQRMKQLQKQKNNSRIKQKQKQKIEQHNKVLLDKRSSQIQNFMIGQGSIIEYKGSWEWTQLFTQISLKNKHRYKIQFKIIKSAYNAIAIGVTANINFHQRSSLTKKYSISYWGDGQIWEGRKIREEGNGFKSNDIVLMEVDRSQKCIQWHINGQKTAKQTSEFLADSNIFLWAYLQMYDEGDKLQLLTYTQY